MLKVLTIILLTFTFHTSAAEKPFKASVEDNSSAKQMEDKRREAIRKITGCFFPEVTFPNDFDVYAAGAYSGKPIEFQLDQSGNQAGQINVAVNNPDKPVALYLGAYNPTLWNVGWTKGTKIIAVFATGYHRQVIAGLPKNIPQLISTFDNKGKCGYHYINANNPVAPNPTSRNLYGRNINQVYIAKDGTVLVGKYTSNSNDLITDDSTDPNSFHDKAAPLAGKPGLDKAISLGQIRLATKNDKDIWLAKTGKKNIYFDYVILKPFQFPAGLYGAHSAKFLLAKNVAKPTGNSGHSTVYDINDLGCTGSICGHE